MDDLTETTTMGAAPQVWLTWGVDHAPNERWVLLGVHAAREHAERVVADARETPSGRLVPALPGGDESFGAFDGLEVGSTELLGLEARR